MTSMARSLCISFVLLAAAACAREETPPAAPQSNPASREPSIAAAHGQAAAGGLRFAAPAGWEPQTPTSSMRKAQYRLPRADGDAEDAEMVVFYFGGGGGGTQANIDRWIGQFQKADGSPAGDSAKVTKRTPRGIPLSVVDVSGTYTGAGGPMGGGAPKPGFRMLAAVAEASDGPWFFKLTGPVKTVAKWEASFQTFLDSVQ